MQRIMVLLAAVLLLLSCSPAQQKTVRIAINPWPGYEFLYLAEQRGFFKAVDLNLELVQVSTLSDSQRAYLAGRVDGFASTLIEAIQVEALGGEPVKVVLAADYSNGSDVIVAASEFDSVSALKGKTVGCEVGSLGLYVLARALQNEGMTLSDVNVVNVEQGDGKNQLIQGNIDAMVTYPPYSTEYIREELAHQIFGSDIIPWEILDTVSVSDAVLKTHPDLVNKLWQAWQMALDDYASNPEAGAALMAAREGISSREFTDALNGVHIISSNEQRKLFVTDSEINQKMQSVCATLVEVNALETDCTHIADILWSQGRE
ncbi:ABC transporter substrate-binding protein [Shewanella corallii]|uniref:ABC transporter substrate-binding protein n=1 Tax=Shewanella corallii TaxID=560080 RepID=A0ABT0N6C7_9GAMM|nr:ABC transporter substrate-binding protein [Shewanella corallii]MCL2913973.1 ABC transporter substrate-binding protein [Shewanella corallii]